MFPFSPKLEAGLAERFETVRWFELGEDARLVELRGGRDSPHP